MTKIIMKRGMMIMSAQNADYILEPKETTFIRYMGVKCHQWHNSLNPLLYKRYMIKMQNM